MKGGSTTKILLETIFLSALDRALRLLENSVSNVGMRPNKQPRRHESSEINKSVMCRLLEFYSQTVSAGYGYVLPSSCTDHNLSAVH